VKKNGARAMNHQAQSQLKTPKTKTEKCPTASVQPEADYLTQFEERQKLWDEYYHCCGGY
jgi:hypothetical protein